MDVRMELSQILITETGELQVIVLKERDGHRRFPIEIGIAEAFAIDRRLKGVSFARPMTHDLLADVIKRLGGELEKIVINDLRDILVDGQLRGTFFAQLHIRRDGEVVEVDSRPSDAIALGVASDTPIFMKDWILAAAAGE